LKIRLVANLKVKISFLQDRQEFLYSKATVAMQKGLLLWKSREIRLL
jgi:hypothetical protein